MYDMSEIEIDCDLFRALDDVVIGEILYKAELLETNDFKKDAPCTASSYFSSYERFADYLKSVDTICLNEEEYNTGEVGRVVLRQPLPILPNVFAIISVYNGTPSFFLSVPKSSSGENVFYKVKIASLQLAKHKFGNTNIEVRVARVNDSFELMNERNGSEHTLFGFSFAEEGFWIPNKRFSNIDLTTL